MKIKDLKEKIKDLDDDLDVWMEGCDCDGEWNGEIEKQTKNITLKRV